MIKINYFHVDVTKYGTRRTHTQLYYYYQCAFIATNVTHCKQKHLSILLLALLCLLKLLILSSQLSVFPIFCIQYTEYGVWRVWSTKIIIIENHLSPYQKPYSNFSIVMLLSVALWCWCTIFISIFFSSGYGYHETDDMLYVIYNINFSQRLGWWDCVCMN